MCVVTQNAAGIGVTAIPDPVVDIAWDGWFYHAQGDIRSQGSTAAQLLTNDVSMVRHVIDSKAMRKIHLTDTIVAVLGVVETTVAVGFAHLRTRILVKLP